MNKQIEEMAKDLFGSTCWTELEDGAVAFDADRTAINLYNAGYRKQSDGEWKQTEEPLGWGSVSCAVCSVCGESWALDDDAIDFDLVKDYWKYCPNCGARMSGGKNE